MAFGSIICCAKRSYWRSKGEKDLTCRKFSLKELRKATKKFDHHNKLGEGAFGSVYRGQLWDGSQIAVKRLNVWSDRAEAEFSADVEILGKLCHKNLLTLRGYCSEGQERLIVYDFMPNSCLSSHLHGQQSAKGLLDWTRRMNIAIGSAEGIAYLHTEATLIHKDIKSSNILLDADFEAKVADFVFAKFIPNGATRPPPQMKLNGYLAPEYVMLGKAKESMDVYSLGILLLELATGRNPNLMFISEWALSLIRDKKFNELADPRLKGKYAEDEMRRVIVVGIMCAHMEVKKRPTMAEVVALLKGEAQEKMADLEDELFKEESGGCEEWWEDDWLSFQKSPVRNLKAKQLSRVSLSDLVNSAHQSSDCNSYLFLSLWALLVSCKSGETNQTISGYQ